MFTRIALTRLGAAATLVSIVASAYPAAAEGIRPARPSKPSLAAETDASSVDSEDPPAENVASAAAPPRPWTSYAPAAIDAPQIRNLEPQTALYVDGSFARSNDLSALPYVEGWGQNLRLSFGGRLKIRRFQLEAELPALQSTTLSVTKIPGGEPQADDAHQTSLSIGDLRLGAQWTGQPFAGSPFLAGLAVRGRIPTHTVRFTFHLADMASVGIYSFPYYFHVEPAILLGGALGPLSLVMNQGPIVLLGPDADFEEIHFVVPTIYLWDSHYAAVYTPVRAFSLSVELNTVFQLGHVDGVDFMKLNNIRAWSVIPGLQLHLGSYRIDAVGRIGLSRGADLFGVVGYGGSHSVALRVTRLFD